MNMITLQFPRIINVCVFLPQESINTSITSFCENIYTLRNNHTYICPFIHTLNLVRFVSIYTCTYIYFNSSTKTFSPLQSSVMSLTIFQSFWYLYLHFSNKALIKIIDTHSHKDRNITFKYFVVQMPEIVHYTLLCFNFNALYFYSESLKSHFTFVIKMLYTVILHNEGLVAHRHFLDLIRNANPTLPYVFLWPNFFFVNCFLFAVSIVNGRVMRTKRVSKYANRFVGYVEAKIFSLFTYPIAGLNDR